MEKIKIKTLVGGIWGGSSAGGTWLAWLCSDQLGGLLRNSAMFIGVVSAVLSLLYLQRIQQHRNIIKAIDEAESIRRLCIKTSCCYK